MTPEAEKAYREDEVVRKKIAMSSYATHNEIIRKLVERDEKLLPWSRGELRPDSRPHPCTFSETAKRAFNTDIIKFMLP